MNKKFITIPITQNFNQGEHLEDFCKRVDDMFNATLLSLEAIDIDVQYDYTAGVAFIKVWY